MKKTTLPKAIMAFAIASTAMLVQAPAANAFGWHPCTFSTNPCPPSGPSTPPSPPSGGGGGGGFGGVLGAGIGLGVGLGIANALRPPQPQVIYQQQPVYVQPVPQPVMQPMPQSMPVGLSAHDQYCLGKYNSYNINTKRYLSFSGKYKMCVSPYM